MFGGVPLDKMFLPYTQNFSATCSFLELIWSLNRGSTVFPYAFLGYQRELNYRRNDKSFSAFGNRRPGSTWFVNIQYFIIVWVSLLSLEPAIF